MTEQGWAPERPVEPRPRRAHGSGTAIVAGLAIAVLTVVVGLGPSGVVSVVRGFASDDNPGYKFLLTQPRSDDPVTYDPCKVIEVAVNPEGAPESYDVLVATAIEHVAGPTGLRFELIEETDERPGPHRAPADLRKHGDGPPPVLVSWSDPDETPELAGRVAGVGGSIAVTKGVARLVYVTGSVTLDRELFEDLESGPDGLADAQAIIDHEFGHLVGLDHVRDRDQLMHATNNGQREWGVGDLAGLARLGGGCN